MKQNVFKPYKENTDTLGEPSDPETPPKIKIKPVLKTLTSRSSSKRLKLAIKRQMAYHHPVSSLDVGTLHANVGRVAGDDSALRSQTIQCVQEAVSDASRIKRRAQRILGRFIEHVNRMGPDLDDCDRVYLDLLCPRVTKKDAKDYKDGKDDGKGDGEDDLTDPGSTSTAKKNDHGSFIWSFMVHLYTGNYPKASGIGQSVDQFIKRLCELG
ncbi:hypothetical protein BGZ67_001388, partial [Mortierella alpina]